MQTEDELFGLIEAKMDDMLAILSETVWDGEIESVNSQRDILYSIFNITKPVRRLSAKKEGEGGKKEEKKEDLSYASLVHDIGY